MAWLKIDQTLRDHRKVCDAAGDLKVKPAHMAGMLVLFWLWAIDNAPDGNLSNMSPASIAAGAQFYGNAAKFVQVLVSRGLLDETPDGLTIHDWYEHAGGLLEIREIERKQTRERVRRLRDRKNNNCNADVTPLQERYKSVSNADVTDVRIRVDKEKKNVLSNDNTKEEIPQTPFEKIRSLWNEICISLPKANGVNGKRKVLMEARWREAPNTEWWRSFFEKIENSAFLTGNNDRGWKATIDWALIPGNRDKITEGVYSDKQAKSKPSFDLGKF